MKALRSVVAATVLSLLTLAAHAKNPVAERAYKVTHQITFRTLVEGHSCSATAVGPHALLTATHCELGTKNLHIDDNEATIVDIVRDGQDHSILFVTATFKSWADFSKVPATIGDKVFVIGNPGELTGVYREGCVASKPQASGLFGFGPQQVLFDLNGYLGDSGAAFFNETGEIVGVLSATDYQANENDHTSIKLTVGYILRFTEADTLKAASWAPEVKK